ncbi:MAG: non-homologous end-joining DNA ligase [Methanotrichaceae archaeon]
MAKKDERSYEKTIASTYKDLYSFEPTNLDKILFPDDGITKGDLIDYYRKISGFMLPHMKDRPVTMHRFPSGIGKSGFFQQNIQDYFPDWIDRTTINKKEGGSVTHLLCNNEATLIYLANLACITPHIWLSRADKLFCPDKIIIDLDPSDGFEQVRSAAFYIKDVSEKLELRSFIMLTGSRGLHVAFPLIRSESFDEARSFSQELANYLVDQNPELFTLEEHKEKRRGSVFLDTLRNSYGQTSVAPYAVRARPGAPVDAPIEWSELDGSGINSRYYNMGNMINMIKKKRDPWESFYDEAQSLKRPRLLLKDMLKSQ